MEENGCMIVIILVVIILALIAGVVLYIIDDVGRENFEEVRYSCVVTHMDIDNGQYMITVVGEDFSGTLKVQEGLYAEFSVGDNCVVVRNGYHGPVCGDRFTYQIEREVDTSEVMD